MVTSADVCMSGPRRVAPRRRSRATVAFASLVGLLFAGAAMPAQAGGAVTQPQPGVVAQALPAATVGHAVSQGVTPEAAAGAYVEAVYQDLFGRGVDPSGLRTWTSLLVQGTPRTAVADSITNSGEYRTRLLNGAYATYLNRTADPDGLQHWLDQLGRGLTIQGVEAGFLASLEKYQSAGGTPRGWVASLYRDVLGRAAGADEVTWWTRVLEGGLSRTDVALGFLRSTERLSTVVDRHYRELLGRSADSSGLRTWVTAIQHGTRLETIIAQLVASQEYGLLHNAWSDTAGPTAAATAKPGPTNTGVPAGTQLRPHYGDIVVTQPGTVIDGLDVFGFITVRTTDVTIRNSRVRGSGPGSFNTGLINANHRDVRRLVIEDVTLVPDHPSVWINGVIGHDFTARRVNTYHVVDGFNIYNIHGTAANVRVESSWVHDLAYFSPDPNHSDNRTHNDAVQIQGGSNVQIVGNMLSAWLATSVGTQNYRYPEAGFGVIVTPNVNAVTASRIDANWFDGSYIPVKVITKPAIGPMNFGQINGNRFARTMRNVPMNGVNQWFTVLMMPEITAETVGNVYDDGSPVVVRRDSGTGTAP